MSKRPCHEFLNLLQCKKVFVKYYCEIHITCLYSLKAEKSDDYVSSAPLQNALKLKCSFLKLCIT